MTGQAPANFDGVRAGRSEAEVGVEGGHAIHIVYRGSRELSDHGHGFGRKITQLFLDFDERGKDGNLILVLSLEGLTNPVSQVTYRGKS